MLKNSLKNNKSEKLESLLLNITESCNLTCNYCIYSGNYEGERTNTGKQMSFETAKKAIDFFMPRSNSNNALIGLYGGEPLNNSELIKRIAQYVKTTYPDNPVVLSMTSNFVEAGSHLEMILENDMYANISIDGPKEVHDTQRKTLQGEPTYDKIIKNLQDLEKKSPGYVKSHIGVNGTVAESKHFPKSIDYFIQHDHEFNGMRLGNAESKGTDEEKDNSGVIPSLLEYAGAYIDQVVSDEQPPKVLKRLFDDPVKAVYMRSEQQMPETLRLEGACFPGERKLFVDTDGSFYMCEKFGKRAQIGNVDKGIDSEAVTRYIDDFTQIRNEACTDSCWSQRLCLPCIQSAKDYSAEISSQGLSQSCEGFKSQAIIGLAVYAEINRQNPAALKNYFQR